MSHCKIIIFTFFLTKISFSQVNYKKISDEFSLIGSCNYKFKVKYYHKHLDNQNINKYSSFIYVTNKTCIHKIFNQSKDSVLLYFYNNLKTNSFDYVSNLFLYQFTNREIQNPKLLKTCQLWNDSLKNEDIKYWEKYFINKKK